MKLRMFASLHRAAVVRRGPRHSGHDNRTRVPFDQATGHSGLGLDGAPDGGGAGELAARMLRQRHVILPNERLLVRSQDKQVR